MFILIYFYKIIYVAKTYISTIASKKSTQHTTSNELNESTGSTLLNGIVWLSTIDQLFEIIRQIKVLALIVLKYCSLNLQSIGTSWDQIEYAFPLHFDRDIKGVQNTSTYHNLF